MGRHHQSPPRLLGYFRFLAVVFTIGFTGYAARAATTTAPVAAVPAAGQSASPEQKSRDVLVAFLKKMEPVRLESRAVLNRNVNPGNVLLTG